MLYTARKQDKKQLPKREGEKNKPGVVVLTGDPRIWKAEAGLLQIPGQPVIHSPGKPGLY
jgi:hypothetical protein